MPPKNLPDDSKKKGLLAAPQPGFNDPDGERIPDHFPPVIDTHIHLFPEDLFKSIWKWFDRHAWPIRYRMSSEAVIEFLLERGATRLVGLTYAHRPGIARQLNQFQAGLARRYPALIALGTVFPGEAGAEEIIEEAFDLGLEGIKLHAHVQCFDLNGPAMEADLYPLQRPAETAGHACGPGTQKSGLSLRPVPDLPGRQTGTGLAGIP